MCHRGFPAGRAPLQRHKRAAAVPFAVSCLPDRPSCKAKRAGDNRCSSEEFGRSRCPTTDTNELAGGAQRLMTLDRIRAELGDLADLHGQLLAIRVPAEHRHLKADRPVLPGLNNKVVPRGAALSVNPPTTLAGLLWFSFSRR